MDGPGIEPGAALVGSRCRSAPCTPPEDDCGPVQSWAVFVRNDRSATVPTTYLNTDRPRWPSCFDGSNLAPLHCRPSTPHGNVKNLRHFRHGKRVSVIPLGAQKARDGAFRVAFRYCLLFSPVVATAVPVPQTLSTCRMCHRYSVLMDHCAHIATKSWGGQPAKP